MNRREILVAGASAAAAVATPAWAQNRPAAPAARRKPFRLKYAPHPGMFKEHAPGGIIDEIKFMADQGFPAFEDNGMKGRPIEQQEQIGKELAKHKMTMGIFVMNRETGFIVPDGTLVTGKPEIREQFLKEVTESIDVCKRTGAKWMTSLTGNLDPKLAMGYQTANVIDCLRRASDILEPHGLVMVYEPLNIYENHARFFLSGNPQGYALMKAVRSPSCKLLYDLYHSQINEGRLIRNFDMCFDEIGYIQTGDTPGRKEPGTGEVNYRGVMKHIHDKGYRGVIGMEHGNSKPGKPGEAAVIASYRDADAF